MPPVIRFYVIFSRANFIKKPLARVIDWVEQVPGNCTHMCIAIEYRGTFMIWEARAPRPRFVSWKEWSKDNEMIWVFSRELKNQLQMFEIFQHLAYETAKTEYSQTQLILILLRRLMPKIPGLGTAILNGDRKLVCTEAAMRVINRWFPFLKPPPENTYDSMGLREAYELMIEEWQLMRPELTLGLQLTLDRANG